MGKKKIVLIVVSIVCVVVLIVLAAGWHFFRSMNEFVELSADAMQKTQTFWARYDNKTVSFYKEYADACETLLDKYSRYTEYPYTIPLENNQAIPEAIIAENPCLITVFGRNHMSITPYCFEDNTGMMVTYRNGEVFLGGSPHEGAIVYP